MKLLILASLIGISSFAFAPPEAEILKGIIIDNQGITIQVSSGGCTDSNRNKWQRARSHLPRRT